MKMGQNIRQEIIRFHKAISERDFEKAEKIIKSASSVSPETILAWRWMIKEIKGNLDLTSLYDDIVVNNFPLQLLYIYFENCLKLRDVSKFKRLYDSFSKKNCDEDSPRYFDVMHSFLIGKSSDRFEKNIALNLFTKTDQEFVEYLE